MNRMRVSHRMKQDIDNAGDEDGGVPEAEDAAACNDLYAGEEGDGEEGDVKMASQLKKGVLIPRY